jgi:hypothetical protein
MSKDFVKWVYDVNTGHTRELRSVTELTLSDGTDRRKAQGVVVTAKLVPDDEANTSVYASLEDEPRDPKMMVTEADFEESLKNATVRYSSDSVT